METPKKQSVRANTPRVLTMIRHASSSSPTTTLQKPPRVSFTPVCSAPVAGRGRTQTRRSGPCTPSVSRARTASHHGSTTGTTLMGAPNMPSRSRSAGRSSFSPPPPLYRPPTTPAEANQFVERLDYEQKLLEAYQQDELRKRGLDAAALPRSKPASRCGSVDSRASRGSCRCTTAPTDFSPPGCRRLGSTSGLKPNLSASMPAPGSSPSPAPSATVPSYKSHPARAAAASAQCRDANAPAQPPKHPVSRSRPHASVAPASAQTVPLRPTSVRLGGPTATQAAAKRSAALRPSAATTAPAVVPPPRPQKRGAVGSHPVLFGGRSQTGARSAQGTASNSRGTSHADPISAASLTGRYSVQLKAKRAANSPLLAHTEPKSVGTLNQVRVDSCERSAANSASVSSRTLSSTVPHTLVASKPFAPNHDRGTPAAHAVTKRGGTTAPTKPRKALTIRHAKVPPGVTGGNDAARVASMNRAKGTKTTPAPIRDQQVRAPSELDSLSLNSIGSSMQSGNATPLTAFSHTPDVYVPRLRLPVSGNARL